MATITLTIPDALLPRVIAGVCGKYNYEEKIQDPAFPDDPSKIISNPESKAEFCKRMIRQQIKRDVLQYEAEQAFLTAEAIGKTEVVI